jgi:hypothetical protein
MARRNLDEKFSQKSPLIKNKITTSKLRCDYLFEFLNKCNENIQLCHNCYMFYLGLHCYITYLNYTIKLFKCEHKRSIN